MREAETAAGERELRFLKVIVLLFMGVRVGIWMVIVIARWSEMCRLWLDSCWILRLEEQTKSRM